MVRCSLSFDSEVSRVSMLLTKYWLQYWQRRMVAKWAARAYVRSAHDSRPMEGLIRTAAWPRWPWRSWGRWSQLKISFTKANLCVMQWTEAKLLSGPSHEASGALHPKLDGCLAHLGQPAVEVLLDGGRLPPRRHRQPCSEWRLRWSCCLSLAHWNRLVLQSAKFEFFPGFRFYVRSSENFLLLYPTEFTS